jgi:hypothetical protein
MTDKKSLSNNKYIGYFFAFRELAALCMFYATFFNIPFMDPDIKATYGFYNYGLPHKLQAIIDSTKTDGSESTSRRFKLYQYLSSCCDITIRNNTDKDISINELRVNGAYEVGDVFVETDSHKLQDNLCCLWKYTIDKQNGLVFKHFDNLPARSKIRYVIYGKFVPTFLSDFIEINASTKSIRLEEFGDVGGFWYFISQNSFVPTMILILIFIGLGIKRVGIKS